MTFGNIFPALVAPVAGLIIIVIVALIILTDNYG